MTIVLWLNSEVETRAGSNPASCNIFNERQKEMIEIKRWDNGEVIHSGEFNSVGECLEDGAANGVSFL